MRVAVGIDRVVLLRFFFFQAEDGIRDLVRSRGLGDVYKRQHVHCAAQRRELRGLRRCSSDRPPAHCLVLAGSPPVSYTHLTLPTSDLV